MPEHELSQLAIDIREGDMSVLLKEYEKEIKVSGFSEDPHATARLTLPIESSEKCDCW